MVSKECRNCGKEFQAKHSHVAFCCIPCRFEYEKKKAKECYAKKIAAEEEGVKLTVIECRRCGLKFIPDSSGFRYCSEGCLQSAKNSRRRERRKKWKVVDENISHDWSLEECPFFSGLIDQDMGMLYS